MFGRGFVLLSLLIAVASDEFIEIWIEREWMASIGAGGKASPEHWSERW